MEIKPLAVYLKHNEQYLNGLLKQRYRHLPETEYFPSLKRFIFNINFSFC